MADQYGRDPFNGTSSDPALCVLVGQPSDYGNPCEKGNYQLVNFPTFWHQYAPYLLRFETLTQTARRLG